jgi:AcrR family transcriptional regulator
VYATEDEKVTQKSEHAEDLRVLRTRKMLEEALIELTVEKGFAAVTVRDITERAMVNRSTFYRHYLDKFDLLEQYTNAVTALTSAEDPLEEKRREVSGGPPPGLVRLLKHVQQFGDFYRVMLGQMGDPVFTEKFRQTASRRMRAYYAGTPTEPESPPLDLRLDYVSCAAVGAIVWWLESDQPCPPEQLASWLSQLSRNTMGFSMKRLSGDGEGN